MTPFYDKSKLVSTVVMTFFLLFFSLDALAATVCEAGCDYTTITEAAQNTGQNGTITVSAGKDYSESGIELFPGVTLITDKPDQKGGVTINGTGDQQPVIFAGSDNTIIGFTITGGNAGPTWYNGGGIQGDYGLTVKNCIITGNVANSGAGGGLYASGELTIINSDITNNQAGAGGGVYTGDVLTIINSKINGNSSKGNGGGVFFGGDNGSIHNSQINSNSINSSANNFAGGGGLYQFVVGNTTTNQLIIDNTTINGNSVDVTDGDAFGGGIATARTVIINSGSISNNSVTASSATFTGKGGGISTGYFQGLQLIGVSITGNSSSHLGGGVYEIGGLGTNIYLGGTISGNTAPEGGGIYCESPTTDRELDTAVSGNTLNNIVNCDGACTAGQTRSKDTGLPGVCASGTQTCRADGVWGLARSVNGQSNEVCNDGIDNDCDGKTDLSDSDCMTGTSRANAENSTQVGDPINSFTGELYFYETPDLYLSGGPMAVLFQRYYASGLMLGGELGNNWAHNFLWKLDLQGMDASVRTHEGKIISFVKNVDWHPVKNYYAPYQLLEKSDGLFSFHDPRNSIVYVFDANNSGRLIQIHNGRGSALVLTYVGSQLSEISDGLGRTLSFSYNADGQIDQVTDGTRTVSFSYNGDNELVGAVDAASATTTYAYDPLFVAKGKMISRTRAAGNTPYTQTYLNDPNSALHGRVSSQTDAGGNITTIRYPQQGGAGVTTIKDAMGNSREHTYSQSGNLSSVSDAVVSGEPAGERFSAGSNSSGQRTSVTDRLGETTRYTYHAASGQISSITHADGTTTKYSYTLRLFDDINQYDLTGITHADGTTETLTYDSTGNLVSHIDQAGNTTNYSYNGNGQVVSSTNVAGGATRRSYNADGTLASLRDPADNETTFSYDALKRLKGITKADGSIIGLSYDAHDELLSSSDENGNIREFAYDANGNLSTIKSSLNAITKFVYDGNDRLVSVENPLGGITTTGYDALGRLSSITNANDNTTTFSYDIKGWLTSISDPQGNLWTTAYDLEGIPTNTRNPLGDVTSFSSDKMGRITKITSPLGNTISVDYDAMGRAIKLTDALGNATNMVRDSRGLISTVELPGAITTIYQRNALGKITQATDSNGNNWEWDFDSSGRQVSSSDPLGNVRNNSYDSRNRLAEIVYPDGLGRLTMVYDAVGNLTERIYSDGTTLKYTFDAENRLTAADGLRIRYDANGRRIDTNGIGVTYDAGGRISSMTLAEGKVIKYAYDANDRLISVTDWLEGVTEFDYDAAGRLIAITRPNGVNRSNNYDADGYISSISEGENVSVMFTRDANGKVIAAERNLPLAGTVDGLSGVENSYDSASQIADDSYDALGRLTATGTGSYNWDLASRLLSYDRNGTSITASYDAAGLRLSRTSDSSVRNYIWNLATAQPVIAIEKSGETELRYYVHTPSGRLLYSVNAQSNKRAFYHFDEMGNTVFVSDDNGATIAAYTYTPYGKLIASDGALDNPFTWQGQFGVMAEGNDFYYVRARYYDATTGRFISRDAKKGRGPMSINPYLYANANPLFYFDSSGKSPKRNYNDEGAFAVQLLGLGLGPVASAVVSGANLAGDSFSITATELASNGNASLKELYYGGVGSLIANTLSAGLVVVESAALPPVAIAGIAAAGAKLYINKKYAALQAENERAGRLLEAKSLELRRKIATRKVQSRREAVRKLSLNRVKSTLRKRKINRVNRKLLRLPRRDFAQEEFIEEFSRFFGQRLYNAGLEAEAEAEGVDLSDTSGIENLNECTGDVDSAADDLNGIAVLC